MEKKSKTVKIKPSKNAIFEGRTKILMDGPTEETLVLQFKDEISFKRPNKKAHYQLKFNGKGAITKAISEFLMNKLDDIGINHHYIASLNSKEHVVHRLEVIPVKVKVRNVAAGRICKTMGIKEGTVLPRPIIEFCLKSQDLGNPIISEDYITAFNFASGSEIDEMKLSAIRANDFLRGFFLGNDIRLVDFKLEFGRIPGSDFIILADEISPDTCRLWDLENNSKLDKEILIDDPKKAEEAYKSLAKKLKIEF